MNFDKAINRLQWQFGRGKAFTPNTTDIDAINFIFEWIENQKNINVLNQELFFKLYIYQLNQEIVKNKSTVFNDLHQKELSRLLSLPLEMFFKSFHTSLHHNALVKISDICKEENLTPE